MGLTSILLAVRWSRLDDVLHQADDLTDKVLFTCSLPMNDTALVVAHTSSGAEALAEKVRPVPAVASFGTVPSEVLHGVFESRRPKLRAILVSAVPARSIVLVELPAWAGGR